MSIRPLDGAGFHDAGIALGVSLHLPAPVVPEPVGRALARQRLDLGSVALDQRARGEFLARLRDADEAYPVMPARLATHGDVVDGQPCAFRDRLGADEER